MSGEDIDLVIITTTSDDREELEKIAAALVQEKLAACCQISEPIRSIYTWNGKVESAKEFGCTIKTTASHIDAVKSSIDRMHKYDVPQIVVTKAIDVSQPYLQWVRDSVK